MLKIRDVYQYAGDFCETCHGNCEHCQIGDLVEYIDRMERERGWN